MRALRSGLTATLLLAASAYGVVAQSPAQPVPLPDAPSSLSALQEQIRSVVGRALEDGRSPEYIDGLVNEAAAEGKLFVPDGYRRGDGSVDTDRLLALLEAAPGDPGIPAAQIVATPAPASAASQVTAGQPLPVAPDIATGIGNGPAIEADASAGSADPGLPRPGGVTQVGNAQPLPLPTETAEASETVTQALVPTAPEISQAAQPATPTVASAEARQPVPAPAAVVTPANGGQLLQPAPAESAVDGERVADSPAQAVAQPLPEAGGGATVAATAGLAQPGVPETLTPASGSPIPAAEDITAEDPALEAQASEDDAPTGQIAVLPEAGLVLEPAPQPITEPTPEPTPEPTTGDEPVATGFATALEAPVPDEDGAATETDAAEESEEADATLAATGAATDIVTDEAAEEAGAEPTAPEAPEPEAPEPGAPEPEVVAATEPDAAEPSPRETRFYTVRRGDSLSTIAERFYDDPFRFDEIFEANRALLTNPNVIVEGQRLRIPR